MLNFDILLEGFGHSVDRLHLFEGLDLASYCSGKEHYFYKMRSDMLDWLGMESLNCASYQVSIYLPNQTFEDYCLYFALMPIYPS